MNTSLINNKIIKIKLIFRCIPFQFLTIFIFSVGAILGIINDGGVLFAYTGARIDANYLIIGFIYLFIYLYMIFLSFIVRPVKFNNLLIIEKGFWQIILSIILMIIGIGLLIYNLIRLRAFDLIYINPGAIAFNITEERGVVIYISTMSTFFVGASGLLDQISRKYVKIIIVFTIILFCIGLILTTRRELALIGLIWLGFLLLQKKGIKYMLLIFTPIIIVVMYVALLFRNIDIFESPLKYFSTGEFEPIRYALLLGYKWTENMQYISPVEYSIPFIADGVMVREINAKAASMIFNVPSIDSALGLPTVTIFTTFLYFGGLVPLLFYVAHVFVTKQCAFVYERSNSYIFSYLYVFSLIRLLLVIRNGELFAGIIDSIVLFAIFVFYYIISKVKII